MILISKILLPKGYIGITIYPFIFLRNKSLKDNIHLINHERIHLRQQLEMLVIPFFLVYVSEFIIKLIYHRNWHRAYRNLSFEREAYENEKDLDYLKSRPFWKFLSYY